MTLHLDVTVCAGLAQYSGDPRIEWHLNTHASKEAVMDAAKNLPYKGGNTLTGTARCRPNPQTPPGYYSGPPHSSQVTDNAWTKASPLLQLIKFTSVQLISLHVKVFVTLQLLERWSFDKSGLFHKTGLFMLQKDGIMFLNWCDMTRMQCAAPDQYMLTHCEVTSAWFWFQAGGLVTNF